MDCHRHCHRHCHYCPPPVDYCPVDYYCPLPSLMIVDCCLHCPSHSYHQHCVRAGNGSERRGTQSKTVKAIQQLSALNNQAILCYNTSCLNMSRLFKFVQIHSNSFKLVQTYKQPNSHMNTDTLPHATTSYHAQREFAQLIQRLLPAKRLTGPAPLEAPPVRRA